MSEPAKMPDPAKMKAAVHAYVDGFARSDPESIVQLFAENAEVEDPIGSPRHVGREAIRQFYTGSMTTGAKLELNGPVRVVQDYAAFAFTVRLHYQGKDMTVDVIDTFRFNEAGEIVEMRAYWGPENMTGF